MKIYPYLSILRPLQWLKNMMLFFPPFLGGSIIHAEVIEKGIAPFISFCLASSSSYIFNDILDKDNDSHHPRKKIRAVSSGEISRPIAYLYSAIFLASSLLLANSISRDFFLLLLVYVVISFSYSLKLKQLPIIDIFCISAGFLLRLQAGGVAFGVVISGWLFICVLLLSLFLSTGKRACERSTLGGSAGSHRKSLVKYPEGFLEGIMYMTGAAVLVSYAMYVVSRPVLFYTVPLCCFGLIRYMYRVKMGIGGDPTESIVKDAPLFVTSALWAFIVGWSIYT